MARIMPPRGARGEGKLRGAPEFPSAEQDHLYDELRSGAAGEALRQFCRDTWGDAFTRELLDLPPA